MSSVNYITNLNTIAATALAKEEENHHFLQFAHWQDEALLDELVQEINEEVSAAIDCTTCGNCCKTLIVNITPAEIERLSVFLALPIAEVKEKYIEESLAGNCFINTMPCHFLGGTSCTIYAERFTECRDFPHLHKDGFAKRLLGTLLHYGSCPIIYNVIEAVKLKSGFIVKP